MDYLSYKTFVWPQNPHTYVEKTSREPQYETVDGVAYFDGMGDLKRTITGSGTFYGPTAYSDYNKDIAVRLDFFSRFLNSCELFLIIILGKIDPSQKIISKTASAV